MTASAPPETTSRRGLLVGLALGLPVIAYGIRGVIVDSARTHPAELARWVVGAAAVNDLVVLPVVLAVGWAARRVCPSDLWPTVRTGMVTTGVLALVAWPFVRGYGRDPANPSLLPRDYRAGLLAAIVTVWVGVAAGVVISRVRRRRRAGSSVR